MKLKSNEYLKYRCDWCFKYKNHKDMYNESVCYECCNKKEVKQNGM